MSLELKIVVNDKGTPVVKSFRDTSKRSMDQVEKSTVKSISKQRAAFKKLGNTVLDFRKIAFSALAVGGVVGYLTKLASDVEETRNKFNVVFGEMAGVATDWAEEFGNAVGRATSDVMKWMSGVQDTLVPLGYARGRAADLSKNIIELAVDVASFNNASDPEVINSFTSAIVGNHEAVRKYGIVMTEAQLKLEALESGIIDTAREMTAQEKVQARINLLFKGTRDAQGDALRTTHTFANTLKRFKAEAKETGESLGKFLIPALTDVLNFVSSAVDSIGDLISSFHGVKELELVYAKEEAIKNVEKLIAGTKAVNEAEKEGLFSAEHYNMMKRKAIAMAEGTWLPTLMRINAQESSHEKTIALIKTHYGDIDVLMEHFLGSTDRSIASLETLLNKLRAIETPDETEDQPLFDIGVMENVAEFEMKMRDVSMTTIKIHELTNELPVALDKSSDAWINYLLNQQNALSNENIMIDLTDQLTSMVSSTLTQAMIGLVAEGKSINQVFKQIGQTILTTVIGALTQAIIKATVLKTVFGFLGVPMFDKGGIVPAYQTGGIVMGGRPIKGSNEVLIGAQPGEGVVTKKGMQDLGVEGLNRLNQGMTPSSNVFNISINTGGGDVDENFLRFKMLPALNKVLEDRAYLGD